MYTSSPCLHLHPQVLRGVPPLHIPHPHPHPPRLPHPRPLPAPRRPRRPAHQPAEGAGGGAGVPQQAGEAPGRGAGPGGPRPHLLPVHRPQEQPSLCQVHPKLKLLLNSCPLLNLSNLNFFSPKGGEGWTPKLTFVNFNFWKIYFFKGSLYSKNRL